MIIKIDLNVDQIRTIEKLIEKGEYSNIRQFIDVAIGNQIEEEGSISIAGSTRKGFQEIQTPVGVPVGKNWRKSIKEMNLEKSQIEPQQNKLIWYFYNRFFPVKIAVYQLAQMIVMLDQSWIELSELQDKAFQLAAQVSIRLRENEYAKKIARNRKLSTGLPTPSIELSTLKGIKRRKKEEKLQKGKIRFMEHVVGNLRMKKDKKNFTGACFELGLISVKFSDDICYVSLSEKGRNFAIQINPILDEEKFERSFSDEETKFIIKEVYPNFKLENKLIKEIVKQLEIKRLTSKEINEIFQKENRKQPIEERVATMGRLSELQIVDWEIDNKGKSWYTLNKEKDALLT